MEKINFITYCNYSYLHFTKNLITSFHSKVKNSNLSIFCADIESKEELDSFVSSLSCDNVKIIESKYKHNKNFSNYESLDFNLISQNKFKLVIDYLNEVGDVYYIDSDVIFVKCPYSYIKEFKDYDLVFQQDAPINDGHSLGHNWVCTGSFFAKKTINTLNFLNEIKQTFNTSKNDQDFLYSFLNKSCKNIFEYKNAKIGIFDPEKIQNGCDAFKFNWHSKKSAMIIHANHFISEKNKKEAMKNNGFWYLN